MSPVCVPCRRPMACERTGRLVRHGDELRSGDEYWCERCGTSVVTGFGAEPVAYAWADPARFDRICAAAEPLEVESDE